MTNAVYNLLIAIPQRDRQRIQQLKAKLIAAQMGDLPGAIRYDTDKVQTSASDPMLESYIKKEAIIKELDKVQAHLNAAVDAIDTACECLTPAEHTVVMMWYVSKDKLENIEETVGYERRTVYRIKKTAISKLDKAVSECH